VIDAIFRPGIAAPPRSPIVADLTVQLMRWLAISASLQEGVREDEPLIDHWAEIVRGLLAADDVRPDS